MKILIILFTSMIFISCSSIYTVKDFTSKNKFYKDFNNSVKYKNVKVTLKNNNSLFALEGSKIVNDSLNLILGIREQKQQMPLNRIKTIKYYGTSYSPLSGNIILKDGKDIKGENIKTSGDSLLEFNILLKNNLVIPLKKVREVYYKTHWPGIIPGLLISAPLGFLIYAISGSFSNFNANIYNNGTAFYYGIPLVTLVGGIVGYLIGFNYTYEF